MIKLTTNKNKVEIDCPYSTEFKNKLKSIKEAKYDWVEKKWNIPLSNVLEIYDAFGATNIEADEKVIDFVRSQNGKGKCTLNQIASDTVEVYYPYHEDIQKVIDSIINKYKVSQANNYYTMSRNDANKIFKAFGKERCIVYKNAPTINELTKLKYFVDNEKIELDYKEPTVTFRCSEKYGQYLMDMLPMIGKDYKEWCYKMPLHIVPQLIGLIGPTNIEIPEKIKTEVELLYEKEVPIKERLKNIKPLAKYDLKTELLPHQIEAFNMGIKHNRLLIADSPGLGKTLSSIAIATKWCEEKTSPLRNCLIICGVNSVKYNWQAEIEKHSYEKSVVFDGATVEKKLNAIEAWYKDRSTLFGIINIEALRNEAILKKLNELTNMVIVDEIHKAKNGQSKQGRALRQLTTPEIRIGLSGTPMTNKPQDLWNILAWLGIENRNMYKFINRYCIKGGWNDKEIVGYKNLDDLSLELKEVMLRRKKEDVIDLPEKTYKTEYIELTKQEQIDYKAAEKGVLEHAEEILHSNNPLTSLLRMRQVTSGLYCETESDNAKLKRLKEILEESVIAEGSKALIFTQYEEVANKYREALKKYNPAYIVGKIEPEERQKEVDRFQNGDCKIAIGTIGAMGTGLTMNTASYVFFIDKDWAQTNNQQSEDRAHRIGTQNNVTIISLVTKDTIDERIENILQEKENIFDAIVEGKAIPQENKKDLFISIIGEEKLKKEESKSIINKKKNGIGFTN